MGCSLEDPSNMEEKEAEGPTVFESQRRVLDAKRLLPPSLTQNAAASATTTKTKDSEETPDVTMADGTEGAKADVTIGEGAEGAKVEGTTGDGTEDANVDDSDGSETRQG